MLQKSETTLEMSDAEVDGTTEELTDQNYRISSEELADELGLPMSIAQPALVAYRSIGIGVFGAVMRWGGMVRAVVY